MRKTKRLNVLAIKNPKVGMHADGDNLYLQVTENGAKSWICRFKIAGRERLMGLGSARHISLSEARERAKEAMALRRKGMDPIEVRQARKNQVANGLDQRADETALYRHFDADNQLLYVGISLKAFQRFCQHQTGSPWWLKIARVTIEQFGTRRAAEEAELKAIKIELPAYNKRHKPKVEIFGMNRGWGG